MTDNPKPMNPNVEPPGYKPPTSAEELLERYAAGERYFHGAKLAGACFREAKLDGVNLSHADLSGSDFQMASLVGSCLRYALIDAFDFPEAETHTKAANFSGANLTKADVREIESPFIGSNGIILVDANLEGSDVPFMLVGVDLSGANLKNANLADSNL